MHAFMLVAYIRIHSRFSFVCRKSHIPYHIILLTLKNICIMILRGNTLRKFGPIGSRQSYFSAHKEIKKPLQLPEILSLLKARK